MHINIHLLIAKTTKNYIENNLPFKLHSFSLFRGSVKPDFSKDVSHFPQWSRKYLINEIKTFPYKKRTDNYNWIFAEKLGIITHFLADYFCYAHSDYYNGNCLKHFSYELKHILYFNKSAKKMFESKNRKTDFYYSNVLETIDSYIDENYLNYINGSQSLINDLVYALDVCTTVCYSIVLKYISVNSSENLKKDLILETA
ncbi:zinc dependent phospholipase C family protein [Herbivorax sp. ANBcel31]|uniref:zinc dependent phospholipase C family protein n=1 Tax=Herbivorax sp. ANBcel31 TaxID=3069754 RepID=UPI0027B2260B|nr:zinc dependent phospholipase C family protein [Herbivorax sp. ANBcel31]MDQ2086749.1 zinc dependent phospholipase C family protein [Herbivorax sp. ANBcel31]